MKRPISVGFAILFILSTASFCAAAVDQNLFVDLATTDDTGLAAAGWTALGAGTRVGTTINCVVSQQRYYTRADLDLSARQAWQIEALLSAPGVGAAGEKGCRLWAKFLDPDVAPLPPLFAQRRHVEIRLLEDGGGNRRLALVDGSNNTEKAALALDWSATGPCYRIRLKRQRVGGVDYVLLQSEPSSGFDDLANPNPIPDSASSIKVELTSFGVITGNQSELGFGSFLLADYTSDWESIHVTRADDATTILPYWPATLPPPTLELTDAERHDVTLQVDLPVGGYLANDVATLVINTSSGKLFSDPITDPSASPAQHSATFIGLAGGQTVTGWVEIKDATGRTTVGPSATVDIPPGNSTAVCPEHAATIQETSKFYTTIQSAYTAAETDQTILMQSMDFDGGDLELTGGINVTLKGGYYCDFLSSTSMSAIIGKVTIRGDKVTVDKIIIK